MKPDLPTAHFFTGQNASHPFPLALKEALKSELHVRLCKQVLVEAAADQERTIEEIEGRHTSVDFLLAAARRPRPITAELQAARDHLKQISESLAGMTKIEEGVSRRVETMFEDYIRDSMPGYVRGLAAMEHLRDWERGLERFEQRLADYIRTLGQSRNNVVAGYDRANRQISAAAETLVAQAQLAAQALEEEIAFVNQLSDLHDLAISGTPCARANLPKVPTASYVLWTTNLRQLDIGEMQAEFDRILRLTENLKADGIQALREAIGHSATQHQTLAQSFVLERLNQVRQNVERHWFDPAETQGIIEHLETQFCRGREIHFSFAV